MRSALKQVRYTPAQISESLAARMVELVRILTGPEPTSCTKTEWRYGRKGSLGVHVAGPKRGRFYDNEAGVYGDALAFIAHVLRLTMKEAYHWALAWLELSRGTATLSPPAECISEMPASPQWTPVRSTVWKPIWLDARSTEASPVEVYLKSRGLLLPTDAPLRFHPACPRGHERCPAMIALMTDPITGEPCGVHRTFLAPNGSGKAPGQARMMLGSAGVVRLVPDREVTLGLGIGEGIETSLAIMQGFGWWPVWAATSAGAIRALPLLGGIECLTIFADCDGAGVNAAISCATRWRAAGVNARICTPPAGDFNDLARWCAG